MSELVLGSKVQRRKAVLREKLIDVAEAQIIVGGLGAVKARDLAAEAGCALGAIYNVFQDIDDVVVAVNGRSFQALGAVVAQAVAQSAGDGPTDQLVAMSKAYLGFAVQNTNLWRALFDLEMNEDPPDWYLAELEQLFAHIEGPVRRLHPQMSSEQLDLRVRALFSSIHGIVLLGLGRRVLGKPVVQIEQMIEMLLRAER